MKNKKVFVSGGAGVIGCEIVKKLVTQGAVVMVGDLVEIPKDYPNNVIYRRGDLNYITQQELDSFNPEIFFHLAATFERSTETYEHWEENFWHNIRLSNHLMTLMRNVPNFTRVVYASSYLIYDKELYNFDEPQEKPTKLNETDPISPRNLTGLAKLAHEMELEFLSHFKSEKFTSICARIYRGYGKNSRDVISRWVRDLLDNKKILVYNPEGYFDYMYAEDSAEGLIRLSNIKETGIVNLGTGRSRKVRDIIKVLQNYFPEMELEYINNDVKFEASEADVSKLKSLINWLPERYLEDTIPRIIKYEKDIIRNETKIKHVLITSISKKVPLILGVKRGVKKISTSIKIFGGDIDDNCIGKHFVDSFWKMPKLTNLSSDELLKYCNDNNIGLIIPTRDGELEYFAMLKKELKSGGIDVMVSNLKSIKSCIDKVAFASLESINAIPASKNIDQISADKFVVKEQFGAGAKSIGLDLNKAEALIHASKLEYPIFQPFVKGYEISVDAYINLENDIKGIVMRKRVLVIDGESQITSIFFNKNIENSIKNIIKPLNLYGHVIFQAIIDENENIHIIECNARFGGASSISLHSGLDSFYWVYLESQGVSLNDYPFINSTTEITQIRYRTDIYI